MTIRELMTQNPAVCTPDTSLQDVSRMMVQCDCGEIPVVENRESMRPLGVVTDRDIVCRAIAQRRNPLELHARDCMSAEPITVRPDSSLKECTRLMQEHKIRRLLVVQDSGRLCGIVAQADVATHAPPSQTAEVVKKVSEPQQRAA